MIVENCHPAPGPRTGGGWTPLTRNERFHEVLRRRKSRVGAALRQLIIMVVYLPIFALTGVEGKMFHPMAFTVVTALVGDDPVGDLRAGGRGAIPPGTISEKENRLDDLGEAGLCAELRLGDGERRSCSRSRASAWCCRACLPPHGQRVHSEPRRRRRCLARPADSRHQPDPGDRYAGAARTDRKAFPEVDTVFAKLGTAEIATDPMPPNVADNFVMLKPRDQWPDPKRPRTNSSRRCRRRATGAGNNYEFTQPIQMRFNELISGVRSDVAVKVLATTWTR